MKKIWREELWFFVTMLITIAVRVVYIQFFLEDVVVNDYYQNTYNVGVDIYQMKQLGLSEIYSWMLSTVMVFCVNSAEVVMYTNVVLQILTVVFVYITIRVFSNSSFASIFAIIVSLVLVFMGKLREGSGMYVFILVAAAVICLMCLMAKLVSNSKNVKRNDIRESSSTYEDRRKYTIPPQTLNGEMREITLDDIEEREHNSIQFIENPLPVPKRREHKEMDYALDVNDDSDFDLLDMTGLDYFDFE